MATNDDLLRGAEEIGEAIRRHARALAENPDDYEAVIAAVNRLRTAAITYVVDAMQLTGWGNPFSDLGDELAGDTEEESGGEADGGEEARSSAAAVRVEATYRLLVKDAESARRLLAERGAPQEHSAEPTASAPTDVVTDLFLADGWDPSRYGDGIIEVVDQQWSCGPDE